MKSIRNRTLIDVLYCLRYNRILLPRRPWWSFNLFSATHTSCISLDMSKSLSNWYSALCYTWRRKWQPTSVFLPGKSHGQRNLIGYSPRGHKESDTTEWLHFTSLCATLDVVEIYRKYRWHCSCFQVETLSEVTHYWLTVVCWNCLLKFQECCKLWIAYNRLWWEYLHYGN